MLNIYYNLQLLFNFHKITNNCFAKRNKILLSLVTLSTRYLYIISQLYIYRWENKSLQLKLKEQLMFAICAPYLAFILPISITTEVKFNVRVMTANINIPQFFKVYWILNYTACYKRYEILCRILAQRVCIISLMVWSVDE